MIARALVTITLGLVLLTGATTRADAADRPKATVACELRDGVARAVRSPASGWCVDTARPIGTAANGVPLVATSGIGSGLPVRAACTTPTATTRAYRADDPCLARLGEVRGARGLVGWARDGHPIVAARHDGPARRLDACHGHVGTIRLAGRRVRAYHYRLNRERPWLLRCFRRRPRPVAPLPARPAPVAPAVATMPATTPAPVVGPAAGVPATPVAMAATPPLTPAFDERVTDYTVDCTAGRPVRLALSAPPGVLVAVDGGVARPGVWEADVDLAPGARATVVVTRVDRVSAASIRCLPADFPRWTTERLGATEAQWLLMTPGPQAGGRGYAVVADARGVPVWWMRTPQVPLDLKLLPNGHLAWADFPGSGYGSGGYVERRIDGSVVRTWQTGGVPADPHDFQLLPNGNALMLAWPPRDGVDLSAFGRSATASVLDVELQEVAPDGTVVWRWNSKDHIALEETGRWWGQGILTAPIPTPDGRAVFDHVHANSAELTGDTIVMSARHLDAVYAISRATGRILWKVGGTTTPQSLAVLGDPGVVDHLGGQHDARLLPDGTLTVHDNATGLGRPPRALRLRIDAAARTATVLEHIRPSETRSAVCCGGSRRLAGGHWVNSWGFAPIVEELTADGAVAVRLRFADPALFSYRANPVPAGVLDAEALRLGMDAMAPAP